MKFIFIAIHHFNLKTLFLKALLGGMLLFGGVAVAHAIYHHRAIDEDCLVEKSEFFPSPNKKWVAKVKFFTCAEHTNKKEVFLVRKPTDRISLLVYSSVDEVNNAMSLSWESAEQLVITIPDTIKPSFPAKQYAGINVLYSVY